MGKPLFSPKSVFWRVNRELACTFAAPRAVLMQIAHPLVAAGVAEHSQFRKHRFARLYRTSMAAAAITFGSRDFALRAVRTINQKHRAVHGVLSAPSGIFPAGTPYDANDPELKLWVLSTITDSTLLVYELFVSKLSTADREQYYADSLRVTELFGIPEQQARPDDTSWTGAEIRSCCRLAALLACPDAPQGARVASARREQRFTRRCVRPVGGRGCSPPRSHSRGNAG